MSARRRVQAVKPSPSAPPRTVPRCEECGFTGWPSEGSTPHTACGGDRRRHLRQPVAAAGADGRGAVR